MAPNRVALTFDAEHASRPNPRGTEQLLEVLAAAAIRATFFLQGRWVGSVPGVARALVDGGHVIGSHGHSHGRLSQLTDEGIVDDVQRAEEAIRQACGVDPRPWFRCPFGDGASDPRVLGAIAETGYRHVGWHVDGEDWVDDVTAEGLERRVREGIQAVGEGAVVLLHGWPAVTPTVVERLLASAADDGVAYVGIDELGVIPVEIGAEVVLAGEVGASVDRLLSGRSGRAHPCGHAATRRPDSGWHLLHCPARRPVSGRSRPVTEAVVLRGVRVVEPGLGVGPPTSVCLTGGRVVSVGDEASACPAPNIELDGLWLAPGLIDLQVNGAAGHDTTEEPDSIWAVGEAIAATGVTAFLPTVITAPAGRIEDALAVLEEGPPAGYRGATPLGLHLEGPFLSPDRYGAHDPAFLRWPDPALAAGWSRAAGVTIVTLAPDLPGSLELIRTLAAKGVVVSLGHSSATLEQAQAGIEAGARYATHLFNAMPPMAHREPGIAVAVLADERVTVGTIPDTIHVHPAMLDIAWRIAGPDRFSIVTDAMAALGMPHGSFRLADREVTVDDTGPRLPDGKLAGSILRLDAGVRNLAAATGRSVETALAAATTVPARLLGLSDRGRIAAGARADFTILTRDFDAVGTIVGGELVWAAPQLAREVPVWA